MQIQVLLTQILVFSLNLLRSLCVCRGGLARLPPSSRKNSLVHTAAATAAWAVKVNSCSLVIVYSCCRCRYSSSSSCIHRHAK
uniref:Secreted protein n=1 Tax=Trichogramma kaykai TaxID=54128 RepID=A0ABD2XB97_9HYME